MSGEQSTPDGSPKKTPLDIMNLRDQAKRLRRSTATAALPKLQIGSNVNAPRSATLERSGEQGGVSPETSSRASPSLSPSARRIPEFIRYGTHREREQGPSQFKQKTDRRQEALSLEELAAVLDDLDQKLDQDGSLSQSEEDKK
ncbi:hypothetical protein GCM10023165_12840 [Variovorax defluvii]|uniref:Uncharacterized protein n=2 Tax=Variovorax defluvii TaxID=913761 RepID=A0ABP8H8W3_9BURK